MSGGKGEAIAVGVFLTVITLPVHLSEYFVSPEEP